MGQIARKRRRWSGAANLQGTALLVGPHKGHNIPPQSASARAVAFLKGETHLHIATTKNTAPIAALAMSVMSPSESVIGTVER